MHPSRHRRPYKDPDSRFFPPASSTLSPTLRTIRPLLHLSPCLSGSLLSALAVSSSLRVTHRMRAAHKCAVSGLSAAHTIYLSGGNVLLLDKNSESGSF